jgi:hypothetical protein
MYALTGKKLYCFILLATVMISCNSDRKKETVGNDSVYTVDFDNTPKEEKIYMSSLFKKVKIIPLETTDESLIGRITEVQVSDGKIFVFDIDHAGLFVFNMDGKFIRRIGREGQGPGEYVFLSNFTVDEAKHEIYLLDAGRKRIIIYDIETGKYLKHISMSHISEKTFSHCIQYSEGRLYADANAKSGSEEDYLLYEIDLQTGKCKNPWLPAECNKGSMRGMFSNIFFYSRNHPHSPKYVKTFMDTVYTIEKDGISPFLAVKSSNLVSEDDLRRTGEDFMKIMDMLDEHDKIYRINTLVEGRDFILFDIVKKYGHWHVLCDNRNGNKSVRITEIFINDILFEDEQSGKTWQRMCCSDEKGVYSILPIENFYYTENLDEKIKKDAPGREKLLNAKEDDNPIIVYFEYE